MKRVCQAYDCEEIIRTDRTFCAMHWSMLDPDTQDEMAEAYTSGQWDNYKLKTKRWYQLVVKARFLIQGVEDENAGRGRSLDPF